MAKYVDGFIIPVPKKNLKAYIKIASLCGRIWQEHGALEYLECVADDVKPGKLTSFPQSVKLKKNEIAVFSYITYKSRKHRDQVLKKVFDDIRMIKIMDNSKKTFDDKRLIYGGFKTVVLKTKNI
jgi:uncharacterized protein YbaA (DUF1428 family)